MSIIFVKPRPMPTPTKVLAVNYDTDFPWISAILLDFANLRFIEALDADESIKHIFLPTFANDAIKRKWAGNANAVISTQNARFSTTILINLHFLISESKF